MKKILIALAVVVFAKPAHAQNIETVLAQIERNNTTLQALRESADAQKLGNRTGIYPSDPEVGFNYLWGKPSEIGNRTDISLTQSFDIPTLLGMRGRVAGEQNELVDLQYRADRMSILLEAKQYCIDLIYYNALRRELEVRLEHALTIAEGYRQRMESGEGNKLEYNKVRLNLSTVQGEISRIEVERSALTAQLKRLNGGMEIALDDSRYAPVSLPSDFDDWFAGVAERNPALEYARQEIEVGKKQLSLSRAAGLPTFSAGYMSERVVGQRFQGVTAGMSIPLWENKNRVRQARASVAAARSRESDSRRQFYNALQILYHRTAGLKTTAENYRRSLAEAGSTDLLKKALDAGEISLLDYILEMGLYYNTINLTLEAERDYQKAFAELSAVEL
jgi:outer membrane protein TolC